MSVSLQKVTEDEADIRLDRWFRRHFPTLTQGVIQRLCRTGQIRVDGRRAEAATRLLPGQDVRVPPLPAPKVPEQPEPAVIDPPTSAVVMVAYRLSAKYTSNRPSHVSLSMCLRMTARRSGCRARCAISPTTTGCRCA